MKKPITVLIIDDHPVVRDSLRILLKSNNDIVVVGEASDGEEGFEKIIDLKPKVAIIDLNMPKVNGMELLKLLNNVDSKVLSIIFTHNIDKEYSDFAKKHGAKAFIEKTTSPEIFIETILNVAQGNKVFAFN